jgi:hypothetical protein
MTLLRPPTPLLRLAKHPLLLKAKLLLPKRPPLTPLLPPKLLSSHI